MHGTFNFYGSKKSFKKIVSNVKANLSNEAQSTLIIEYPKPDRNLEHYQYGLKRMTLSIDSSYSKDVKTLRKLCNVFSDEEERNLKEYTPWLRNFINPKYFKNKILSDCLIIFREHSLISVYNIFQIFRELGLKPENTVYYSKGDRCKNIYRIEDSFKKKGYSVFVLSPFESVSKTGKSEDERITPKASKRVFRELKPFFEKASKEDLKVVVFDDGGLLVTTVVDLFSKKYEKEIYSYIETTKGGMHAISSRQGLSVTVINLADCAIKNLLNSVIGHSIVQRMREMIPHIGLRGQNTVVVGYGTLGRAISKDLRRLGMSVYICDNDSEKIYEAVTDGFPVSKKLPYLIKEFKPILVMGCTGLDALTYNNLSVIQRDTYVATVSSNEIKQSYPEFDQKSRLKFVDNYARIYDLPTNYKLVILGNGASLNLYNGEGANHSEYQPFLAAMLETIIYSVEKGPVKGKLGLDTGLADFILAKSKILEKYLEFSKSLLG